MDKKRRTILDERRNRNETIKSRISKTETNRKNYVKHKDRTKKEARDAEKTSEKKDRGDIKKEEKRKSKIDEEIQVDVQYAGDGGGKQVKKMPEEKPDNPRLYQVKQLSEKSLQRIYENMNKKFKPLNIYMKRELAQKYTFRKTEVKNEEDAKKDEKVEKVEEPIKMIDEEVPTIPVVQPRNGMSCEQFIKHEEHETRPKKPERRPVIKTISSKNDPTKMYKAVTFVEHRKGKPLQLRVPKPWQASSPVSIRKTPVKSKLTMTQTSKSSLKTKSTKSDRKYRSKRKRILSPEISLNKHPSPTTEVARWAPSSVTGHTKPYYEAWVNTTLAAISRGQKQSFIDNESLIRSFQQVIDDVSTEVDNKHDCRFDERKTGKIKVNTKNKGRWERVVANLIANKKV